MISEKRKWKIWRSKCVPNKRVWRESSHKWAVLEYKLLAPSCKKWFVRYPDVIDGMDVFMPAMSAGDAFGYDFEEVAV
jgi:hypothetical protein